MGWVEGIKSMYLFADDTKKQGCKENKKTVKGLWKWEEKWLMKYNVEK